VILALAVLAVTVIVLVYITSMGAMALGAANSSWLYLGLGEAVMLGLQVKCCNVVDPERLWWQLSQCSCSHYMPLLCPAVCCRAAGGVYDVRPTNIAIAATT
jgi:hypothetical protein